MDYIQEAIASRDLVVWAILLVLLLIVVKILKSLGTGFFILLILIGIGFALAQVFPGFVEPIVEWVKGGWLGD